MSALTSLARAHAVQMGRALPITTVRHVHIARRPLVFVPLTMAGEANAPLAAMIGDDPDTPQLLIVPQPRDRSQRFDFAHSLALTVLHYVGSFSSSQETIPTRPGRAPKVRYADAPQLWVPNHAGIEFIRLFGRSTRFRSTSGPYAVPLSVPMLGKWLTFFAERSERAGSSLLVAAADVLARHWATGQSPVEDANLASIVGWIEPPPGLSGAAAAAIAEDPVTSPPAGPSTDPSFDRVVLAPAIREYDKAAEQNAQRRVVAKLEAALRGQIEPTWHLMWRTIGLVRALPPGAHVTQRCAEDRDQYTRYFEYVGGGGRPQPKRDSAVAAAIRLNELERYQATYDAQRALDDPLIMADYRITGEAFVGTVIQAELDRCTGIGRSRVLRPLITVHTEDPVRLSPGQANLRDGARPNQTAEVIDVTAMQAGSQVVLELTGGMGRSRTPPEGSVPVLGDHVCYSTLSDGYQPRGTFPSRDNTPWTHGGPPLEPTASQYEAREEWS